MVGRSRQTLPTCREKQLCRRRRLQACPPGLFFKSGRYMGASRTTDADPRQWPDVVRHIAVLAFDRLAGILAVSGGDGPRNGALPDTARICASGHWLGYGSGRGAVNCALPGFVDSKNEEKTERNAGYLVVSHSGGGMLRQGTRKGIRRTPANRGMRAHRIVKSLDISEDVCHGLCP